MYVIKININRKFKSIFKARSYMLMLSNSISDIQRDITSKLFIDDNDYIAVKEINDNDNC